MTVSLQFFQVGFCQHIEALCVKGGKWKVKKYPALVTLIHHPKFGSYLFDTGYSQEFFEQTKKFPGKLYSWVTPVTFKQENAIATQLEKNNISLKEIQGVILSHFHADHIAGLKDFPTSTFYCLKESYEALKSKKAWPSLIKGFLPGLLPSDFVSRLTYIDNFPNITLNNILSPFDKGYDFFSDGSVIAVLLPGHAKGQIGLLCKTENKSYFLVADACWDALAYTNLQLPHRLANLIMEDVNAYKNTINKLHHLNKKNPDIIIVPSHCEHTLSSLINEKASCNH